MFEPLDNQWRCVVRALVEALAPYKGQACDLCYDFDFP